MRTEALLAENEAGGPLWPRLAEPVQIGKRVKGWGARTLMKDASSTDVILLDGFFQGEPSPVESLTEKGRALYPAAHRRPDRDRVNFMPNRRHLRKLTQWV